MSTREDSNIRSAVLLPSPATLRLEYPLPPAVAAGIDGHRRRLQDILTGADQRLLVMVGPCSIHEPEAALEYASRLLQLRNRLAGQVEVMMRVYFEKPRTTVGWKGLIYDPDLNGDYNIVKGIAVARRLMLAIAELGLPVASELLEPVTAPYLSDLVSWAGIGARTVESPTHRQLASGLPMPVGVKNGTSGDLQVALGAMTAIRASHSFIGVMLNGHTGVFQTRGNPLCHLVLRGGSAGPNCQAPAVAAALERLAELRLGKRLVIDCSHGNSGKDHRRQPAVFRDVLAQRLAGNAGIAGMMLESYLQEGRQALAVGERPARDVSVTDGCIGWERTEELLLEAAASGLFPLRG